MARRSILKMVLDHHGLDISKVALGAGVPEKMLTEWTTMDVAHGDGVRKIVKDRDGSGQSARFEILLHNYFRSLGGIISIASDQRPNLSPSDFLHWINEPQIVSYQHRIEAGILRKMDVAIHGGTTTIHVPKGTSETEATARAQVQWCQGHLNSAFGNLNRAEMVERLAKEKWEDCQVASKRCRESYEQHLKIVNEALALCNDDGQSFALVRGFPGVKE